MQENDFLSYFNSFSDCFHHHSFINPQAPVAAAAPGPCLHDIPMGGLILGDYVVVIIIVMRILIMMDDIWSIVSRNVF